jgi:hypothetical protein
MPSGDPLYTSSEGLQKAVDKYINECKIENKFPNVADLAYSLGYASRQSIYDLQEKPLFSYTIKRAILFIESATVNRALTVTTPTGSIFVLKNMGWKDKIETEHSGSMEIHRFDIPNKKPIGSSVSFDS